MSYFMVDIEADGPIPGDYSMDHAKGNAEALLTIKEQYGLRISL